jgi:hypothetical protein
MDTIGQTYTEILSDIGHKKMAELTGYSRRYVRMLKQRASSGEVLPGDAVVRLKQAFGKRFSADREIQSGLDAA